MTCGLAGWLKARDYAVTPVAALIVALQAQVRVTLRLAQAAGSHGASAPRPAARAASSESAKLS
jgi:hypothetical protein